MKGHACGVGAVVVLLSGVLAGCGSGKGAEAPASRNANLPSHLAALHASDLTKGLREKGLACKSPQQERDTQHWICEASTPLVQYFAEFYGKVPGRIEYVRVVVTQPAQTKPELVRPLVGYVAGLKYAGSDPAVAKAWVEKNMETGGQTTIGGAKLKLSGTYSRLVFELKAAGSDW